MFSRVVRIGLALTLVGGLQVVALPAVQAAPTPTTSSTGTTSGTGSASPSTTSGAASTGSSATSSAAATSAASTPSTSPTVTSGAASSSSPGKSSSAASSSSTSAKRSASSAATATTPDSATPKAAAPNAVAAAGGASLGIDKSVLGLDGDLTPGKSFDYQLTASCSSLTVACQGATVTDVLPAGLDITDLPQSNRSQTVTFDAATRRVTITFTQPLPPPNPAGSTGLTAGSVSKILIGVRLPDNTDAADGSVITNTATASATNAPTVSASADVTVSVPRVVTPVPSKSWTDSDNLAQSGANSTVTLGVSNNSSTSAHVTSLSVVDSSVTNPAAFNTHDVVALGPVTAFPAGADRVTASVCTQPVGTACTPAQLISTAPTAGPAIPLPAGVTAADITGVVYTFTNSSGADLPRSATGGSVQTTMTLRDTDRTSGTAIDPASTVTGTNCATGQAVDRTDGTVTPTTQDCANYSILSRQVTVGVHKDFFSDPSGTFAASGTAIAGQNSPVSARTVATNTSLVPVASLTITDPSAAASTNLDAVDVSALRLEFPTGATNAAVTVVCRDGSRPAVQNVAFSATPVPLTSTGCGTSFPTSVSVTYTGTDAQGNATIAPSAQAGLGLHGTLNANATAGSLNDCASASATSPDNGRGTASGTDCAALTVATPVASTSGTKRITGGLTGGVLVQGQPLTYAVTGSNSGNLPLTNFSITDPAPAARVTNPFTVVRLTAATVTTTPASVRALLALQVLDGRTNTWVAYNGTDSALLNAARGIRVVLNSGAIMPAGASVNLSYTVQVRDGVTPGTTLQNCQQTTSTTATSNPGAVCSATQAVQPPSTSGSVQKFITPATVTAPVAGVAPTPTQVRLRVANNGNLPVKRLVLTDSDATFFDQVDFVSLDGVNFPPGANRVQVDACTTGCASDTWIAGTPQAGLSLPAGVTAASVRGVRFTFTNSGGGYSVIPGTNYPAGNASCPAATVCYSVAPRVHPVSNPAGTVPTRISDTATASAESPLQTPGTTYDIGPATAAFTLTPAVPQLSVNKTPATTVSGPGAPIPFDLTVTNTGKAAIPDLVVTDPIPAGLVFDGSYAGPDGSPYAITSSVPVGTPDVPKPVFTGTRDPADPSTVTKLSWSFAGFDLLPGSTLTITVQMLLAPGTDAGSVIRNTFGAGSSDTATQTALTCASTTGRNGSTTGGAYGPGTYCTSSATVTARGGSDLDAQKWVTGDEALGFFNTLTGATVTPGDVSCPLLVAGGKQYTRYPCIANVLAGQSFQYLLRVVNAGNTPATQIRLEDGLPHTGDTGVLLTDQDRGTEWSNRPVMTGAPTLSGPGSLQLAYTTDAQLCTSEIQKPVGTCAPGHWTDSYSSAAQGFRAYVNYTAAAPLAPGGGFSLIVPMQAPADLANPDDQPVAWNSFAHTDFVLEAGQTTPSQLPLVEPPKVGVAMPFGTLTVTKQLSSTVPAGSVVGPFTAQYSCVVTPATGAPVTVATGTGTFAVGSPLSVTDVPVGAKCSVWETDTGGASSDHSSQATAEVVTIGSAASGLTNVTLLNTFADASLVVTKSVTGGAAGLASGPYTLTVDCLSGGTSVAGYPKDLVFPAAGSQTLTGLPFGSVCTATEADSRGATGVTVNYSGTGSATISPTSAATIEVDNSYDAATLAVTKRVVGGGAGPYSFAVVCVLAGTTVGLPAADATFALSADQTHTLTVPAGTVCTVTETNVATGDTVTYDGSATARAVTVTGAVSETITNTFAVANNPPPPPSTSTSPTPAPTTSSATGGSTTPSSSSSPPLAFTGATLAPLVGVGALCVIGGLVLLFVRRPRRKH